MTRIRTKVLRHRVNPRPINPGLIRAIHANPRLTLLYTSGQLLHEVLVATVSLIVKSRRRLVACLEPGFDPGVYHTILGIDDERRRNELW